MVFIISIAVIIGIIVAVLVIKKTPGPTKKEMDPNADLRPLPPPTNGGTANRPNP